MSKLVLPIYGFQKIFPLCLNAFCPLSNELSVDQHTPLHSENSCLGRGVNFP